MIAPNPKQHNKIPRPATDKRTKYARARVKAGLTVRALVKLGFGMTTVCKADSGDLPKHRLIREAYLKAIGLGQAVSP
jgi:hypothetical protein